MTLSARPPFQAALRSVDDVAGWMTDEQARRLWDCAGRLGSGERIAEIGSFQGRSTIILATAAVPGVEVIAIDPHAGNDRGPQEIEGYAPDAQEDHVAFTTNLERAGVGGRVRYVRERSQDALGEVDGNVDLLYIDGAHRYQPARADIRAWGARVRPGGTMLIHDSFNAVGVTLAQARELASSSRFRYIGRDGSLAEYRRTRVGAIGRVRNLLRHLVELPYVARNQIIKALIVAKLGRLTPLLGNPRGQWPY
jgi:predicted O-methyltransferase YrrM